MRSIFRIVGVCCLCLGVAAPAGATILRLDGVGPLRLGMTRGEAVATGWLAHRGRGCPLGGSPPITYRFDGRRAPRGLRGGVEFSDGRLTTMTFTAGVRTVAGVRVGRTTPARMAARYRALGGFGVSSAYDEVFAGIFVHVSRHGRPVLGGFAAGPQITMLGIPRVPVCE